MSWNERVGEADDDVEGGARELEAVTLHVGLVRMWRRLLCVSLLLMCSVNGVAHAARLGYVTGVTVSTTTTVTYHLVD